MFHRDADRWNHQDLQSSISPGETIIHGHLCDQVEEGSLQGAFQSGEHVQPPLNLMRNQLLESRVIRCNAPEPLLKGYRGYDR